jgi:hypothetical protein
MVVDPLLEVKWSSNSFYYSLWSKTGRITKGYPYHPYNPHSTRNQASAAACRARHWPPRHGSNQTGFRLSLSLPCNNGR